MAQENRKGINRQIPIEETEKKSQSSTLKISLGEDGMESKLYQAFSKQIIFRLCDQSMVKSVYAPFTRLAFTFTTNLPEHTHQKGQAYF